MRETEIQVTARATITPSVVETYINQCDNAIDLFHFAMAIRKRFGEKQLIELRRYMKQECCDLIEAFTKELETNGDYIPVSSK